ncbi:MAG: MoaD/ThiS family protein [Rhodospirillales bacterium]|nr:MoaD/ThiS family protein [Rhodospirillales bacterium]
MAQIVLTNDLGRQFANGETTIELEVSSVREMLRELDRRYPGIGKVLQDGSMAMAIDGEIFQEAFLETIGPNSEVFFLPAIKGG